MKFLTGLNKHKPIIMSSVHKHVKLTCILITVSSCSFLIKYKMLTTYHKIIACITHPGSRKRNGYGAIFTKRNKMLTTCNKILHKYFDFAFFYSTGFNFLTSIVCDKTEVLLNSRTIVS